VPSLSKRRTRWAAAGQPEDLLEEPEGRVTREPDHDHPLLAGDLDRSQDIVAVAARGVRWESISLSVVSSRTCADQQGLTSRLAALDGDVPTIWKMASMIRAVLRISVVGIGGGVPSTID
jgi:hypothetical protein